MWTPSFERPANASSFSRFADSSRRTEYVWIPVLRLQPFQSLLIHSHHCSTGDNELTLIGRFTTRLGPKFKNRSRFPRPLPFFWERVAKGRVRVNRQRRGEVGRYEVARYVSLQRRGMSCLTEVATLRRIAHNGRSTSAQATLWGGCSHNLKKMFWQAETSSSLLTDRC
jgi:hypothetical protein